jgi:hypothetical protein
MPAHDWTRVSAGIFHDFHHAWIEEIKRTLNRGILPPSYYAMAEQFAGGFGPDVVTLQELSKGNGSEGAAVATSRAGGVLLAAPKLKPVAETEMEYYRRKQTAIAVRHVSGDEVVAVIEVMSPGNKANQATLRAFVEKAARLIEKYVHVMILDLFPPGHRDPQGIHGALWEEIAHEPYVLPADRPLTLASYEAGACVRAYVVQAAVGENLTDMPLFLQFEKAVEVPLEKTYQAAFAELPQRWQRVLE